MNCPVCGHLRTLHDGALFMPVSPCDDCRDCQYDPLVGLLQRHGKTVFDPTVREAVAAFKTGQHHSLIDQLRREMAE